MTDTSAQAPHIHGYHAHVYYDAGSRHVAENLSATLGAAFPVELGRLRDDPIGPHPVPQFHVVFKKHEFQDVVPWLMLHRQGLDILVHPLTDDMVDDHTVYALWLGAPVTLRLDTMQRRGYGEALLPSV
ncbi:MAG TPA: DOPA 4,5-dioxygenase family protein [Acetobacteraceae bacterium]|jgi:DOPA 4,5-dioxygenase